MAAKYAADHTDLTEIDLETGLPTSDLSDFQLRTARIEAQLNTVTTLLVSLQKRPTATTLAHADDTVTSIREQLGFLADQNRSLAHSKAIGPASLRIRIAQFGKLSSQFSDIVTQLEAVREKQREEVIDSLRRDVVTVDPNLGRRVVEDAIQSGNLSQVLQDSPARFQLQDLQSRNAELEQLTKGVVRLRELFLELSILAENQQNLVNDIEYDVHVAVKSVEHAEEEIIEARRHQKSARKKKFIIAAIVAAILAVILIILLITLL